MKAIGLTKYLPISDDGSLIDLDLPLPEAVGHDLLVSVRAISVNPVDTKIRAPKDGVEDPPRILGWDAAGVVVAVGPDVSLFSPGDEVFYAGSVTRPGTNSEFHLVDERIVGTKPKSLSFAEAAALPFTSITAWEALFDRMRVARDGSSAGKSLLVIGGAGGVGSIAIQLAKKVAKVQVIATASRQESRDWCLELGADHVVNHREDIPAQLETIGFDPRRLGHGADHERRGRGAHQCHESKTSPRSDRDRPHDREGRLGRLVLRGYERTVPQERLHSLRKLGVSDQHRILHHRGTPPAARALSAGS